MWLKTENFSNACGTSTLKSLLPQAFAVSNVHPRPRKRPPRCTLDCGFKTPESPALRGFVGGLRALATAALYLVLKSNGLPRPKIRLKKFGFSPKSTSTNIAKKLPLQRCFKPLLIALFNFSHKRPTFAFTSESGYTLGFPRKIAHSGSHGETGRFPPPATARSCAASGIATERIAGESGCTPYGVCPLSPAPRPRWAAQFFCASAKPTKSVAIAFILW